MFEEWLLSIFVCFLIKKIENKINYKTNGIIPINIKILNLYVIIIPLSLNIGD